MANLVAAATLLFRDRFSAGMSAAARQADRATDRMASGAERMARTTSRAADRAERATDGLARGTRDAGRETGRATRLMDSAWRGLDILDDISGVAGMVWDLTAGFREAAAEVITLSREVESALAKIDSIEAAAKPGAGGVAATFDAGYRASPRVLAAAQQFALGRAGVVSEMAPLYEADFIRIAKEGLSAGFEESAAIALAGYSAGLGYAAEGTTSDAAELLRPAYALMADPAADAKMEVARLADQAARTQAFFDTPTLPLLTEAVTTAAPLASQHGIPSEVVFATVGAFHDAKITGSEAGEALKSILEEFSEGMEKLGLAKVTTAAGAMDFPATIARLREYRAQSGLSDTDWADHMKVFGEEGASAIATLTGSKVYPKFAGAVSEIAESEGVVLRRLGEVADTREMQRTRIAVKRASSQRRRGDRWEPMDRAQLDVRNWWQDRRAEALDTDEWLRNPDLRPGVPTYFDVDDSTAAGRAIPVTLAEGVGQGGSKFTAEMENMLQRGADEQLPHSDARRGPLAQLTASGRAIPETLATGVEQGAGVLTAAMTAALPLPGIFAATLESPALPTLPPLVADSYAAELDPPAAPVLPPLIAASAAADLEPPALPALPPLVADSYAAELDPPAAPVPPPLIAASAAADLEPPALPTLPPLVADTFTAELDPPAAPVPPPLIADSAAADLEPPALPTLPPLVADTFTAELDPPAAPVPPPLIADSAAADLEPPALPTLPPLVADTFTADLDPPAAPASMPLVAASLATELEPPALPTLPPLVADSYAAELDPPATPVLPPLIAASAAADLEPPALPTLPALVADADLDPSAAPDPAPPSTAPASAPPLLRQSPAPSGLAAAVRDLTREIRRLRTENGAGVTIEHVELHAEDADLMRAAEGLAALRGGP